MSQLHRGSEGSKNRVICEKGLHPFLVMQDFGQNRFDGPGDIVLIQFFNQRHEEICNPEKMTLECCRFYSE